MGKIAFALGVVGTVVLGIVLSGRLEHRDYSGSIVHKLGQHTTCPTFWVSWDKPVDLAPEGMLKCACLQQPQPEAGGAPMHPPKDVHDAAMPMDGLSVSYTEFTSLGGKKQTGLSYILVRGSDRQAFVVSPASGPYTSFAMAAAIPLVAGIVLGVLLGLIPKKKTE